MLRMTMAVVGAMLMLTACGENKRESSRMGESATRSSTPAPATASDGSNADDAPVPARGDHVAGEQAYQKACLACHGADGRGNGGLTGADLVNDKTRLARSDQELFISVSEGKTDGPLPMPPQKSLLSPQEIRDAIAYIRHRFGGK